MNTVYYEIVPSGEEVIRPMKSWKHSVLDPLACPLCGNILAENRTNPIDVDLDWDGYPPYLVPLTDYTLPLIIMRQDLYDALSEDLVGWPVGRVCFQNHDTSLGNRLLPSAQDPGYRSIIVPTSRRCRLHNLNKSIFRPCRVCGRQLGSSTDGSDWLDAAEIGTSSAISTMYGFLMVLSLDAVLRIPTNLRSNLKFSIVSVKSSG
jgi:hypothetical protein